MMKVIAAFALSLVATSAAADINERRAAEAVSDFLATAPASSTRFIELLDIISTDASATVFYKGFFQNREVIGTVSFVKLDSGQWRATGGALATGGFLQQQTFWVTYNLD